MGTILNVKVAAQQKHNISSCCLALLKLIMVTQLWYVELICHTSLCQTFMTHLICLETTF